MTADDLRIITDPWHPMLNRPADVVDDPDKARHYIPAMLALLRRSGEGGLSAPQVGIGDSVIVTSFHSDWPRIFINPSVTGLGEPIAMIEGCKSNRGPVLIKERHPHVIVNAFSVDGEQFILDTSSGYYAVVPGLGRRVAQVIQHAMEHLDGVNMVTGNIEY